MAETIYTQEAGRYHAQYTVGGWVVVYIEDQNNARNVDGGKVHKSRQNAYAKADRLNHPIKYALKKTGMAEAEYGSGYIANVQDEQGEHADQYSLTLRNGAMPPFETRFFDTLDELEQYAKHTLPQPLHWQGVKGE